MVITVIDAVYLKTTCFIFTCIFIHKTIYFIQFVFHSISIVSSVTGGLTGHLLAQDKTNIHVCKDLF